MVVLKYMEQQHHSHHSTVDKQPSLLETVDTELADLHADVTPLFTVRHQLFDLPNSQVAAENHALASDGLYDEPSYNDTFIRQDMSLRGGGVLEFHNESENYNPNPADTPEFAATKHGYRRAILAVAQEHGFVAKAPGEASSPIDRELGILDSELEPIPQPVDVIVAGAAGKSNIWRLRDTIRNIESGAVTTDHIILTGCERPVSDAERNGLSAIGFRGGQTEFESLAFAAEDLLGITLGDAEQTVDAPYGTDLKVTTRNGVAMIGDQEVQVTVLSAPFDPERLVNGNPANRANTEETFLAAAPLLKEGQDVLIESHDTWVPYQKTIGQLTLGAQFEKTIHATCPFKADRVFYDENGEMDLRDAQGVVDEITKVYHDLVRTRVAIENQSHDA